MRRGVSLNIAGLALLLLAACARQAPDAVAHTAATPGFLWGLWHGFVFPFAWMRHIVSPQAMLWW